MNITVNSQLLAAELRLLNKITPSKPTLPVMAYVRFHADERLHLEATDLEVGLQTSCPAAVHTTGTVILPAKKLFDLVDQFPDLDVTIEEKNKQVVVSSGSFRSRLQTLPVEEFHPLPYGEGEPSTVYGLSTLINRTQFAIAEKSSKYVLDGALLSLDGVAAMVATDSKRLSVATAPYSGPPLQEIIPSKTLDILREFEGPIACLSTDHHLFFTAGLRTLVSRKLDGQFPGYDRIIPKGHTSRFTVGRSRLAAALRRVGVVSETNFASVFQCEGSTLTVTSQSAEVGDAIEQMPISYEGPTLRVCVNWRFVLDFLEAAQGESVTVELTDDKLPMLLTDGDFLNVVMLMRV